MGLKRSVGTRSFIDSVLHTLDDFYGDVVQHLQEWQPPAPTLKRSEEEEVETKPASSTGCCDSTEPIDNTNADRGPVARDSSNGGNTRNTRDGP